MRLTNDSEWMTLSDAGRLVSRSANTIRNWADQGKVRAVRTGLGRLVDRAAIEAIARQQAERRGDHGDV